MTKKKHWTNIFVIPCDTSRKQTFHNPWWQGYEGKKMSDKIWLKCHSSKVSQIHIEIRPNYHSKNFTLWLSFKERLRGTLKWPTYHGCCVALNLSHQSTGHGLCQAPRICSILHKNARKKNSPQSNNRKTKTNPSTFRTWQHFTKVSQKIMHQCQRQENLSCTLWA